MSYKRALSAEKADDLDFLEGIVSARGGHTPKRAKSLKAFNYEDIRMV